MYYIQTLCNLPPHSYNGALNMLSLREDNADQTAVWVNKNPGGLDFLRPFLLSYEREEEEMVIRLSEEHEEEIRNLQSLVISVGRKSITVHLTVVPAMHDHKELTILAKKVLR